MLEKTATISSNDPELPNAIITVKARIKPVIMVNPSHLHWTVRKGEPVSGEVEITANMEKPLTLKPGLYNLAERINYTLTELEKGRKFVVRFKRTRGVTEPLNGYLRLQTNYPEKPEVAIFIRCDLI